VSGPKAWDSRTLASNHEQEIYVDPAFPGTGDEPLGLDPFRRGREGLTIRAWPTPAADAGRLWGYRYVSGLLTTHESFSQTFGYFEVKAMLPRGRGLWPAFWMAAKGGAWPPELDILEQTGGDAILQTVHMAGTAGPDQSAFRSTVRGATGRFHTYGVLWTPTRIVWFVDRRQTAAAPTPPDLRQPLYLLINLAVGGDFPGAPDVTTRWPAKLRVAYVRAYAWPGLEAAGTP
jgi:beta-glucanase (GH16 family)